MASNVRLLTGGMAAYMEGRWKEALEQLDEEAVFLRTTCSGASWEINMARFWPLRCLYYLGRMRELRRRAPEFVDDADARGDLYASTDVRVSSVAACRLVLGDWREAAAEVERALARWSRREFDVKHFYGMVTTVDALLYGGDVRAALAYCVDREALYRRSGMRRLETIRCQTRCARARAALAFAARELRGGAGDAPVAAARRAVASLRGELPHWSRAWSTLLAAGLSSLERKDDETVRLLVAAETGFDGVHMRLHASAARRRRGEIVGGAAGRALVAEADAAMTEEEIADPARWTAVLAPGFEDQ